MQQDETVEEGVSYTTEEAQPEEIEEFQVLLKCQRKSPKRLSCNKLSWLLRLLKKEYHTEEAQPEEIEELPDRGC